MTDVLVVLGTFGLMVFVGAVSDLVFRRTMFPDTIPLISLGVLLGPVVGLLPAGSFESVGPLVGSLALIVILLDQGMETKFRTLGRSAPRALLLAVTTFVFSTVLIGLAATYLLRIP